MTDLPTIDGIDKTTPGPISPKSPPPAAGVDLIGGVGGGLVGEEVVDGGVGEVGWALDAVVFPAAVVTADEFVGAFDVVDPVDRAPAPTEMGFTESGVAEVGVADTGGAEIGAAETDGRTELVGASLAPATEETEPETAVPLLAAVLVRPALGDEVQDASAAISISPASAVDHDPRLIPLHHPGPVLVVAASWSMSSPGRSTELILERLAPEVYRLRPK